MEKMMNPLDNDNLDDAILQEKHLVAREHFLDAWEAGLVDGIDAEIIAAELIEGALRQFTRAYGAHETSRLVEEIRVRDEQGDFLPQKSVQ